MRGRSAWFSSATQSSCVHARVCHSRDAASLLTTLHQYYNDAPRLLEAISAAARVTTDCCLRGGASFATLLSKGSGLADKFSTPGARRADGSFDIGKPTVAALLAEPADFVVMNDYTQQPARASTRADSADVLARQYAPLLRACGGAPVLLETWAYRAPAKGSDDLGDNEEFSSRLAEARA